MAFAVGTLCALVVGLYLWQNDAGVRKTSTRPTQKEPAIQPVALEGAPTAYRKGVRAAKPSSILVEILDADERVPLGGARIHGLPPGSGHAVAAADAMGFVADANGQVTLPSALWEGERTLVFAAEQHRPQAVLAAALLASSRDGRAQVFLPRGIAISGRVVTPWGAPVPDAEIAGYGRYGADFDGSEQFYVPGPATAGEVLRTRTDAAGSFRLAGISKLPIRLEARKRGYVRQSDSEAPPLLAEREDAQSMIVLRPRLVGGLRVVDDVTDNIVSDFRLQYEYPQGESNGPIMSGLAASSYEQPNGIPELGAQVRAGEYWIGALYGDTATSLTQEGHVRVTVTSPWYQTVRGLLVPLRSIEDKGAMTPVIVRLLRSGSREDWGSLRIRVTSTLPLIAPLAWVYLRVEQLDSAIARGERRRVAWTYRLDLDERGVARRSIPLAPGHYNVRLADGTGWAAWKPGMDDPWSEAQISSTLESSLDLNYRASLLRISVKSKTAGPIGMFTLAVHYLPALPEGKAPGGAAPLLAQLSENEVRWWESFTNSCWTHLRREPGIFELLVPPGKLNVWVGKTGFLTPDSQSLDLLPGQVGISEFILQQSRSEDDR